MSRISYLVRVTCLVAALMAFSGICQAAMWVGGEMGPNMIGRTDAHETVGGAADLTLHNLAVSPAVLGGGTIGYDFVNSGVLGANYPEWMGNFGVLLDMTFNRFPIPSQTASVTGNSNGVGVNTTTKTSDIEGKVWPLLFGVYGHFGCWSTTTCPGGVINPYLVVGPAIAWSSIRVRGVSGTMNDTTPAFGTELGLRIILAPYPLTLDVAFRYRYLHPSYDGTAEPSGQRVNINFAANSFTPLLRLAYHF
ncbi:MAG: hypothetical protein WCF59_10415 [Desulfobaccales bacterium]